ncbi:M23 family metallopeptidase [Candidatus Gracilibacteria bacterium]|nr:M23 family metallopeptidase [Candidatus Gracilibacteria bacterium]
MSIREKIKKYKNCGLKCGVHEHINKSVHKHICKHGHKHIHRIVNTAHDIHHHWAHFGELIIIVFALFFTFIFAGGSSLPNNTNFVYPLQKVSTLECRTLYRNDMPENCKINLPIIYGANYDKYKDMPGYRDIYTTLWAASYSDSWNQSVGAHAGLDIATARGTPLYSLGDGKVYFAGWNSAYGNVVKVKYKYKGEIIYVIYAHMDTIEIENGKTVSRGQRIGTVGNSGNTFGALGGYHVHFQIAKDAGGWPKYSYLNCPDLSKGHYKIIQNGLCREQLIANEYDPIKLLEQNYSTIQVVQNPVTNTGDQIIENVVPAEVGTSVNNTDIVNVENSVDIVNTETVVDTENAVNIVADKELKRENLVLDLERLDPYSKHFFEQNNVWIESDLNDKKINIGDEGVIVINIDKKNPDQKYNGILTIPFDLITTNTNISLDYSSIRLVNNGKVEIKVKGLKSGYSSILINFGGKKISKVGFYVN